MNDTLALRAAGEPPPVGGSGRSPGSERAREASLGIGLWAFMGVATSLFSLFLLAFALRMNGSDWNSVVVPWQSWLSTAALAAGSLVLHRAVAAARAGNLAATGSLLRTAGICLFSFLVVQSWAWQSLLSQQVTLAGNPAASFFFLLTAMHALHAVGGVVGWALALRALARRASAARVALATTLCARYWHFLLAVWLVLFAALGWLSPEWVRYLCGTA